MGMGDVWRKEGSSTPWCRYPGRCCVPERDTGSLLAFRPASGEAVQGCLLGLGGLKPFGHDLDCEFSGRTVVCP